MMNAREDDGCQMLMCCKGTECVDAEQCVKDMWYCSSGVFMYAFGDLVTKMLQDMDSFMRWNMMNGLHQKTVSGRDLSCGFAI